jgi:hypothetical protein
MAIRTNINGSDFIKVPIILGLSWMQAADHAIKQWRSFLASVEKTHGHGPDK